MKNEIIVSFGIFDFNDVSHTDITNSLGIIPVKIYVKGEKKNIKNPDSPFIKRNGWVMDSGLNKYSSFEDQLDLLLATIESKIDIFKPLCERYYCELSCALFIYFDNGESPPWIHLGSKYNKILKELNIEFDLDLYVFPDTPTPASL